MNIIKILPILFFLKGSNSNAIFYTRLSLYNLIKESGITKIDEQVSYLTFHIQRSTKSSDEEAQKIRKTVYTFLWKLREKKAKCNRKENAFLTKNTEWLETSLSFELPKLKVGVRGRPDKAFDTCSERAKRFKTQDIRETCSKEMLAYATQMSYRAGGRSDIARKITDLTSQPLQPPSPKPESKSTNKTGMSDDEGLAMVIDADLSRNQYEIIREKSKVFPSYKCIQNAKKRCYPEPEYFRITEYSAEIQLQALLNLTSKRLCMAQENDFNILDDTVKYVKVNYADTSFSLIYFILLK